MYDITKFVPQHPGSGKIMLAAGGAIDPFWHTYQQHNTTEILTMLEAFRIGNHFRPSLIDLPSEMCSLRFRKFESRR